MKKNQNKKKSKKPVNKVAEEPMLKQQPLARTDKASPHYNDGGVDNKTESRSRTQSRSTGQGRSQMQGRGSSEHYKDQNGRSERSTSPSKK